MNLATTKKLNRSLIVVILIMLTATIIFINTKGIETRSNQALKLTEATRSNSSAAKNQKIGISNLIVTEHKNKTINLDDNDEFLPSITSLNISKNLINKLQISDEQSNLIHDALMQVAKSVMNSQKDNRLAQLPPNPDEPNSDTFVLPPLNSIESDQLESQFNAKLESILGRDKATLLTTLLKRQINQNLLLLDFGRLGAQFKFDRPAEGSDFFVNVYTMKDGKQVGGCGMQWSKIPEPWAKLFAETSR